MKKILVIRLGVIGDVILTSPAVLNLKLSFPGSRIIYLTREHLIPLAEQIPGVDEALGFPLKASLRDLFMMGEYLDKQDFDIVVDLHGNLRSKYLSKHITASVKSSYPKRRFRRYLAVKWNRIDKNPPHTVDLYNTAVEKCGGVIYTRRPSLGLPAREINELNFDNDKAIIAFAPGASFPTKQWPVDRFKETAAACFKQISANIVILLAGSDSEMAFIKNEIPARKLKVFVLPDLLKLARVLEESDLLVCNDSGLMHLSASVGTPVTALFGPTHPTLGFNPRGLRDKVIQAGEYCSPCSLHGKRECFRDRQYCFDNITVVQVMEAILEQIESNAKGEKALFIDRDGTLIVDKDYLDNPNDVEPETGSIEAIRMAKKAGFKIIIVSNQSGVARGLFDETVVFEVNQRIMEMYRMRGLEIDDILYCPHLDSGTVPEYSIKCECRKPSPGMVETACLRHNINPFRSFVIGDKLSDIHLSKVTGARSILVRTGHGAEEERKIGENPFGAPETIVDNLFKAVKYITDTGVN